MMYQKLLQWVCRGGGVAMLLATLSAVPAVGADNPAPAFTEKLVTQALLDKLRGGGYVLYMRHGLTDTSRPDRVPEVDLNDCSTQRPLTEAGRQLAARVGAAIRQARIPVGEVVVSPLCRTKESAQAAFGDKFRVDNNLMYTANLTSGQKKSMLTATRTLLSAPSPIDSNRVIVAHAPNLMDLMGYFVKPEATVAVFRPLGEQGYEYLGSIPPDRWQDLPK